MKGCCHFDTALCHEKLWYKQARKFYSGALVKPCLGQGTNLKHWHTYVRTSSSEPLGEISDVGNDTQNLVQTVVHWQKDTTVGYGRQTAFCCGMYRPTGEMTIALTEVTWLATGRGKPCMCCAFLAGRPMKDHLSRVESGLPSSIASGADGVLRKLIVRVCSVFRYLWTYSPTHFTGLESACTIGHAPCHLVASTVWMCCTIAWWRMLSLRQYCLPTVHMVLVCPPTIPIIL